MLFIKATKTKYEIQELTKEDIYYGLETAVHVIKILENVCNTFDNLDDYYKLYTQVRNGIDLKTGNRS